MKKEFREEGRIHAATPSNPTGEPHRKSPYVKPRAEPAGSVFEITRALGGGPKDIISGSALL